MDIQMDEDAYLKIDYLNANANANNNTFQLPQPSSNLDSDIELESGEEENVNADSSSFKHVLLGDNIEFDNKVKDIDITGKKDEKGTGEDVKNDSELEYESEEVEIEIEPTYNLASDIVKIPEELHDEGGNNDNNNDDDKDKNEDDDEDVNQEISNEVFLGIIPGSIEDDNDHIKDYKEEEIESHIQMKDRTTEKYHNQLETDKTSNNNGKQELESENRGVNVVENNGGSESDLEELLDKGSEEFEIEDQLGLEEEIKEFEELTNTSPTKFEETSKSSDVNNEIILLSDAETPIDLNQYSTKKGTPSFNDDDIQIVNEVELNDNKNNTSRKLHNLTKGNKLRSNIPVYVDLVEYVYKLYQPTTKEDPDFADLPVLFDSPKEILYCSLNRAILLIKSRMNSDEQSEITLIFKDLNNLRISEDDINGTYCTVNDIIGIFDDLREKSDNKEFFKFIQIEVELKLVKDRFINRVRSLLSYCGDGKCLDDLVDEGNTFNQEVVLGGSSESSKRKAENLEETNTEISKKGRLV